MLVREMMKAGARNQMLSNGALIASRYRLQRLIATGGMGQV